MEVALHIYKESGDIHQVFPFGAARFQYGADIPEYAVALGFEVEAFELAMLIQFQSRNAVVLRIAGADAGKEHEIAHAACVRVKAHWLGRT